MSADNSYALAAYFISIIKCLLEASPEIVFAPRKRRQAVISRSCPRGRIALHSYEVMGLQARPNIDCRKAVRILEFDGGKSRSRRFSKTVQKRNFGEKHGEVGRKPGHSEIPSSAPFGVSVSGFNPCSCSPMHPTVCFCRPLDNLIITLLVWVYPNVHQKRLGIYV